MLHRLYSIRDSKGEIYHTPHPAPTDKAAVRNFGLVVNDPKTHPGMFPEDFDLYYIGEYDDQTGKIAALDTPHHVIKGVHLKSDQQTQA